MERSKIMQILQMMTLMETDGSSCKPHDGFDEDQFLDANEYVEYLSEL